MPENIIQFTNVNNGDTITNPFTLNIEYTLLTQQAANMTVSDANNAAIQTTPQLAMPCVGGNPQSASVMLTYPPGASISAESISAVLTDSSLNVLATDSVSDITVSSNNANPPIVVTPQGGGIGVLGLLWAPSASSVSTGSPLSGHFVAAAGTTNSVSLIVESRKKSKRRKIEFIWGATVTFPGAGAAGTGDWNFNNLPGAAANSGLPAAFAGKGYTLRVIFSSVTAAGVMSVAATSALIN